jgi:pimeloyl-ACP methyl ester carboxylesterase
MGPPVPIHDIDGVEHRHVLVDGLRLHYATAGADSGTPIVLLHGWPQHWWSWRALIAPLGHKQRVICPDIRGLGWSEGSIRGYDLSRLAADLIGLLDALAIERACLVGHDWGAAIGYHACLEHPERFVRFIALASVTPWSAEGAPLRLWLRPWHIPALGLLGTHTAARLAIARDSLRSWRHAGSFTIEETDTYLNPLRQPSAGNATRRFYSNLFAHEIPRYARHSRTMHLRTPTLHINGAEDPLTRGVPHSYRHYADDMRLQTLPGCGHFIPEEQPEQLLTCISAFLSRSRP